MTMRGPRLDEAGGGRDADETGDGARGGAEDGGLAGVQLLGERPSTRSAAAAAMCVFRNAEPARPLAASAEPALKPNQPNHRMPAPSTVSGRLLGCISSLPWPLRLPSTIAAARAAAADEDVDDGTASEVQRAELEEPALPCHTQWASGL